MATKTNVMQWHEFERVRNELQKNIDDAIAITERLMGEVYNTPKEFEYDTKILKPLRSISAAVLTMKYPKKAIDQRRERVRDDYYKVW